MFVVHGLDPGRSKTLCGMLASSVEDAVRDVDRVSCARCVRCGPGMARMRSAQEEVVEVDINVIVRNLSHRNGSFILSHGKDGLWTATLMSGASARVVANNPVDAVDIVVCEMGWDLSSADV